MRGPPFSFSFCVCVLEGSAKRWPSFIFDGNRLFYLRKLNQICTFVENTHIMAKNGYKTLNLPASLVEELKLWRMAFSASYGKNMSYAEILRGMLDSLEDSEPAVVAEMDRMLENHPELKSYLK